MGIRIDVEVPEWLVNAAAKVLDNPEAGLFVAFAAEPDVFYPALRVSASGMEYSIPGGMKCAQPIEDVVAYRIGPDGETVAVGGVTVELVSETVVSVPAPKAMAAHAPVPVAKTKAKK